MKKKFIISCIVVITAAVIITGYFIFKPIPIVKDVALSHVVRVQITDYNDKYSDLIDVEDYDEDEILNYLNTCKEQKTLQKSGNYQLGDVTLRIMLRMDDSGTKELLLGDINYSSCGVNTLKYKILDSEEVKDTLLTILNTDEKNAE